MDVWGYYDGRRLPSTTKQMFKFLHKSPHPLRNRLICSQPTSNCIVVHFSCLRAIVDDVSHQISANYKAHESIRVIVFSTWFIFGGWTAHRRYDILVTASLIVYIIHRNTCPVKAKTESYITVYVARAKF